MNVLASLFGFLGPVVSGFFGFKGEQAKTVQDSIALLKQIDASDAQAAVAASNALSVILTQGSWLERTWRPFFMVVLIFIVVSYWFFGYVPHYFNDPMTPMMLEIFTILKIGLGGYLPLRTMEKIAQQINIGSIIRKLIEKKVL